MEMSAGGEDIKRSEVWSMHEWGLDPKPLTVPATTRRSQSQNKQEPVVHVSMYAAPSRPF
jgi:hypothetical protein